MAPTLGIATETRPAAIVLDIDMPVSDYTRRRSRSAASASVTTETAMLWL